MIMKQLFTLAAAATILAACSINGGLDQTPPIATERVPLTIGYSMGTLTAPLPATRGNIINIQDKELVNTNNATKVGLFLFKEDGVAVTDNSYEKFNVTSTSMDNTTMATEKLSVLTYADLNYPDNKTQTIDIYTYAPHVTTADVNTQISGTFNNISSQKIKFTTVANQTDEADFVASDVLWGCAGTGTNIDNAVLATGAYGLLGYTSLGNNGTISADQYMTVKKNGGSTPTHTTSEMVGAYWLTYDSSTPNANNKAHVVVPMIHRGSKIIIKLKTSGMDQTKLQNAEVKFNVDYNTGALDIHDGSFVPDGSASASDITLTDRLGIAATVTNVGDPVTAEGIDGTFYTCSAVVVPQVLSSRKLINVDLYSDNRAHQAGKATKTATYAYTPSTTTTLVAGKKYTYEITVKASGLDVTATVEDWVDDSSSLPGSGTGNAELQ